MNFTLFIPVSVFAGILIGYFVMRQGKFDEQIKKKKAEQKVAEAKEEAVEMIQRAREETVKLREYTVQEIAQYETQNKKLESILKSKEELLKKKEDRNHQFTQVLVQEKTFVENVRSQTKQISEKTDASLFQKVGMLQEELKGRVIEHHESNWKVDSEQRLHRLEEWAREEAAKIGKQVLESAIYRYADASSAERREGVIVAPSDAMKGKIIGQNGQTLAALEKLFEIDIVLNDGPNTISFSCFNLVTREIARIAIEKLLNENMVNEAIIQKAHELAKRDMDAILLREGERITGKLHLKDIPQDLLRLVGRLNYRTSYGQNIMRHCLEVGYFSHMLAGEIGADEKVAWLGGFFHDIGKAIDQEVGGSHDVLSKEILEKYGFPWEIVHAAWTHHDAIPQETVEAVLVKAADAMSAGRPGARSLSIEQYIQKIKELESTASSFEGVKKAFAISAGREVRAMVDSDTVSDEGTQELARVIAKKIEEKGGYPGKIKVTTIRLTKASGVAKSKVMPRK